jgi:2-oxoglutarate ferredoxin oxidoreductase subunit gamma
VTCDIIMAGFGGQGILMIGNLLALTAMEEGRHVTYFPAYVVGRPKGLLIMNGPSMERFLPMLAPGGDLIINSSLVEERQVTRNDVRLLSVPADDIARNKIGSRQMASMVALGSYVARSGIVKLSTVFDCLPKVISKKYEKFIPMNINALKEGAALAGFHA